MHLHQDKIAFRETIELVADYEQIDPGIVEKDYYVTMFLKTLVTLDQDFVFKGGTSLSKCFHNVKRFSEDIDLNYDSDALTRGKRRKIAEIIKSAAEQLGLSINNAEELRSGRDYNRYLICYASVLDNVKLKPQVIVETYFGIPSFPIRMMTVETQMNGYLTSSKKNDIIMRYELLPFDVKVQSLERTFIDKIFALCDYVLSGDIDEHSRHLYDIHKIYPQLKFNRAFSELIIKIREERKKVQKSFSAQNGIIIKDVITKMIETNVYKTDFETTTQSLLFEDVTYQEVMITMQKVIDLEIF